MNERIQELIKQCRWQEIVVEDGEEWIHAHFDEHKFAKLIIRECCDVLYDNELGGYQVNYVLKEHFGVES